MHDPIDQRLREVLRERAERVSDLDELVTFPPEMGVWPGDEDEDESDDDE